MREIEIGFGFIRRKAEHEIFGQRGFARARVAENDDAIILFAQGKLQRFLHGDAAIQCHLAARAAIVAKTLQLRHPRVQRHKNFFQRNWHAQVGFKAGDGQMLVCGNEIIEIALFGVARVGNFFGFAAALSLPKRPCPSGDSAQQSEKAPQTVMGGNPSDETRCRTRRIGCWRCIRRGRVVLCRRVTRGHLLAGGIRRRCWLRLRKNANRNKQQYHCET
ncbi:MAG: hypothetical protein ALAOOOJD_03359 [bacterium]|nr:hypothetical protein [bacterium]